MENSVDRIVDSVVKNPKLNKLAPLKQKGLWKDQLKAVLNLVGSFGNPVSGTSGVANFVIDEIDIIENYKLSEFFRKFTVFALELTDMTVDERINFSEEVQQKANDFPGNVLMGMVDRLDNIHKEKVLASLMKARIHQFISIEDFFRLSSMLERIPSVDLDHLEKYQEGFYDESGDSELLFATGALQMASIDKDEGNKYVLSLLGEKLVKFGLQKPVKANRTKGTGIPYSFENVTDEEMESWFNDDGKKGKKIVQEAISNAGFATKDELEAQSMWVDYDQNEEKITLKRGKQ